MNRTIPVLAAALLLSCMPALAQAQAGCTPEHAAMGHCTLPKPAPAPVSASACPPAHAAMGHCTPAPAKPAAAVAADPACPPEHAAMGHCTPRGGEA